MWSRSDDLASTLRRATYMNTSAVSRGAFSLQGPRLSLFRIVVTGCLLLLAIEGAGVWHELSRIRDEQVKNEYYRYPAEVRQQIPAEAREELKSRVIVQIRNEPLDVNIQESVPLEVEVEH